MTTPSIISTPQPPVGTVYPFIGSGTTIEGENSGDPNGWVICDGQRRDASDGRYAELAPLLDTYLDVAANTNTPDQITPPDFTSRMPIGHTGAAATHMTQGGTGSVTLQASDIPPLILVVGGQHSHTYERRFAGGGGVRAKYDVDVGGIFDFSAETVSNSTGVTGARHVNNNQDQVSLLNLYSRVNYIMKY